MDKRALKILLSTYWSSSGWTSRQPNPEDFAYAKARRVMFDPIRWSHDGAIARLRDAVGALDERRVADGFLASLSTRRLDWRSALGSYAVGRRLPIHPATAETQQCSVCGLYAGEHEEDANILNFERLKWGGVRHRDPVYGALDLELFCEHPPPAPTAEDLRLFRELVAVLKGVAPTVTSAMLHQHFPSSLKANKPEREAVVGILGLCGVLGTAAQPGFGERFVPMSERRTPDRHFVDMAWPASWWTGAEGVNDERLHAVFGHAL